jgi:hypothetical protein
MLNKNSMLVGVLVALVFPLLAWVIAGLLKYNAFIINKPALPYFVAIAFNLFILKYLTKNGLNKTASGLIVASFTVMALIFILKIQHFG